MTTSSLSIQERVANGVALLDAKFPGWTDAIDVSSLNLASSRSCVLGQMFGDFTPGARHVGLSVTTSSVPLTPMSAFRLQEHGFLVVPLTRVDSLAFLLGVRVSQEEAKRIDNEYLALTQEWAQVITDRRAKQQLAEIAEPESELVSA